MSKEKQIPQIFPQEIVKAYYYGETLEMTTSNGLHTQTIQILPNHQYKILKTGKIMNMNLRSENRADNLKTVQVTMRRLRRLITNNFFGGKSELWITLTYATLMRDSKQAYVDFKKFMRKLRQRYKNLEYIVVIEPQASGSLHFHLLLKRTDSKQLQIPNSELSRIWGQGFTKTKRLKSSDKVANYVIAYVSNLDWSDGEDKKKYIKGARLHLYPKGIRIYRYSRGIKKPLSMRGFKKDIMDKFEISGTISDFSRKTMHLTDEGKEVVYITEFFNNIIGKEKDEQDG
ncbi:replicative protein [Lactococcus petauri]|uniref:rolling circle replication-associated protein n=1 Tax=Lactococcus petauri TaxID=1940789 RepID=UPI0022E87CBC|nr:replicative protein [Lactococcus petauri]